MLLTSRNVFAILSCSTALISSMAHAQAPIALEEVVVTAERRTEDLQRTATSVTAVSGEDLQAEGRYSVRQILENVPGVSAVDVASTTAGGNDMLGNNITIRGVTPNQPSGAGPAVISPPPTTGVYVDGVYEGIGSNYDIERVELSRGPQGTLFGRSATSGVFAVRTINPDTKAFSGTVSAEAGNYELRHYTGALNIPVNDQFAVRISADHHEREGYYNGKGGAREKDSARIKALYKPTESISILLGAAMEQNDTHTGGISYFIDNSLIPQSVLDQVSSQPAELLKGHNESRQFWAQISWDLNWATLSYQPTYRSWKQHDQQYVGLLTPPGSTESYTIVQDLDTPVDEFMTHEILLASNPESRIKWQAGFNYYRNNIENSNFNHFSGTAAVRPSTLDISDVQTTKDTVDYGIFGEATYPFSDTTRLTVGMRYDWTTVGTTQVNSANLNAPFFNNIPANNQVVSLSGDEGERKYKNFSYKLRLEHDLSPENLIYASISTGFVPGDVNITKINGSLRVNAIESEKLTAYEIGTKNRFFDNRVQVNASAYYYDYGGFQTAVQDPNDFTNSIPITVPATNIGAELEALWLITAADRVGLNFSYVKSEWKDKPALFAAQTTHDNRSLLPWSANANYSHTFALPGGSSLSAQVSARYQPKYRSAYLSASDQASTPYLDPYNIHGARFTADLNASWRSADGRYGVTGYVRNITDERYIIYPMLASTGVSVSWTDPRVVGLVLSASF